jgi:uncharacterized protein
VVTMEQIRELSARIASEFQPDRIILFGSHAYGTPDAASDVDLLVVLRHEGDGLGMAVEILNAVDPRFSVDLIVRTPEDLERRVALNDFFLRQIVERGVVLHESAHV